MVSYSADGPLASSPCLVPPVEFVSGMGERIECAGGVDEVPVVVFVSSEMLARQAKTRVPSEQSRSLAEPGRVDGIAAVAGADTSRSGPEVSDRRRGVRPQGGTDVHPISARAHRAAAP